MNNIVRKGLKKVKRGCMRAVVMKEYFWASTAVLKRYESEFRDRVIRSSHLEIVGDVRQQDQKAMCSHAREYAYEQILKEGKYSFKHPYVAVNPYGLAPMTALILFQTDRSFRSRFTVEGNPGAATVVEETGLTMQHRVPVYGFLPDRCNLVRLELIDEAGNPVAEKVLPIYIDGVPKGLKNILQEKNFSRPSAFSMIFLTGGSHIPFAFDQNCDIRYYLKTPTSSYGIFPLKNGRLLWGDGSIGTPTFANAHTCQFHEMDYMGRIHRTIYIEKGMHHFVTELPNGNIVGISNTLDGCTEDCLIEIDRKTGKIIQTIDMRLFFGEKYRDMVDWVHPNSLAYDEADDTMMVCLRNVHSVLKFRWSTKEIVWALSIPEFWEGQPLYDKVLKPQGEIKWNYQAHAAQEIRLKNGQKPGIRNIMVFDNHRINRRPCKQFNRAETSFINIFEVNEQASTVQLVKQFEIPFSLIRSNAVYDPVFHRVFAMEGCLPKHEPYRGKVIEMDYETGESLNTVSVGKDFFSGYPFHFDYSGLLDAIEYPGMYLADGLSGLVCTNQLPERGEEDEVAGQVIHQIFLEEEFLYFKARDHAVQKFFLLGKRNTLVKDYTNTWQTNNNHKDRKFFCVVSLRNAPADEYELAIQYQDQLYHVNRKIKINRR